MTDPIAEFFDGLERQDHLSLTGMENGTFRFDVVDGKRSTSRFITMKKGDLSVSGRGAAADCRVRAPRQLAEGIVSGEVNAFAAVLRGELEVEGDPKLMVVFQRLLPGPPASRGRRPAEPVRGRS
jgi:putative sterol carrier protein